VALSDASGNIEWSADPRIVVDYNGMLRKRPAQPLVEARQPIGHDRCVELRRDMKAAREMRVLSAADSSDGETAL